VGRGRRERKAVTGQCSGSRHGQLDGCGTVYLCGNPAEGRVEGEGAAAFGCVGECQSPRKCPGGLRVWLEGLAGGFALGEGGESVRGGREVGQSPGDKDFGAKETGGEEVSRALGRIPGCPCPQLSLPCLVMAVALSK
jgi:hypothetical protein